MIKVSTGFNWKTTIHKVSSDRLQDWRAGLELVPKRAPAWTEAVNIIVGIGMQPGDQKPDSSN